MLRGVTSIRISPPGLGSSRIAEPHHAVAFAGSTRSCQTVSGLASISTARRTSSASVVCSMLFPLLSFGLTLERLEPVVPEAVEEPLQLGEPLRPGAVQAPGAVPSFVHESGLPQDGQMLGDRGP